MVDARKRATGVRSGEFYSRYSNPTVRSFEEAMAEALGEKKKEGEKKEGEGEEKAEGEAEKTSAAKVKAKKKKILAKMAADPQYVAHLVAKYQGR